MVLSPRVSWFLRDETAKQSSRRRIGQILFTKPGPDGAEPIKTAHEKIEKLIGGRMASFSPSMIEPKLDRPK